MKDITEIDKNFKLQTSINKQDIKFINALSAPISLHGVFFSDGAFRRMPEDVAKSVSGGVYALHTNCAGGRVRFKTDSPYVAIVCKMGDVGRMPHFALTGSAGFDLYEREADGEVYVASFIPNINSENGYEQVIELGERRTRELTINFPLYSGVKELYVGISESSKLETASNYAIENPVIFYGSSITQGGCASRPGNSYQAVLSRRFDFDYINLGFSGNAKAEDAIIEYISGLDMSLFVYDYDHNAPSEEHLALTHEKMFLRIRESHPDLPIIMMNRPKIRLTPTERSRHKIIETTYNNAMARGDKNVYFISGEKLMDLAGNDGTVDNCHPNDLGFASMAKAIGDLIKQENLLGC